ncbi:hypothetical protein A4A49_65038, partial [Nicotiana attenuata]
TSPQPTISNITTNTIQSYANLLQPKHLNTPMQTLLVVPIKTIECLHGKPVIRWKKAEVRQSIVQQKLTLAVLGKFSYGKTVIQELRKAIPIHCELKGACLVGLIEDNIVLIRLSLLEDYVHLLSKPAFYLKVQSEM